MKAIEVEEWLRDLRVDDATEEMQVEINGAYCEVKDVGIANGRPTIYVGDEVDK